MSTELLLNRPNLYLNLIFLLLWGVGVVAGCAGGNASGCQPRTLR